MIGPAIEPAPAEHVSRLRKLRQATGFSVEEIAEMTGVPRRRLGKIEHGSIEPTGAELRRLAVTLAVIVRVLLGYDAPEEPHRKSSLGTPHRLSPSERGRRWIPGAP